MDKLLLIVLLFVTPGASIAQAKRILIVATNVDSVGNDQSGTYLKEIAYPFRYFIQNGYEIDVVTPLGGRVSIYHTGDLPPALDSIRKDPLFRSSMEKSLPPNKIDYRKYLAIFYPGGHGQYFDVLSDEQIARIAASVYESGGVMAAAGHGMSSWINIRLNNCKFLVDGVKMTCFPTWAEKAWMKISGFGKFLPFDMESQLTRRGALLVLPTKDQTSDNRVTKITDEKNRIVTGSFAFNAQWVAEEVVRLLQKENEALRSSH